MCRCTVAPDVQLVYDIHRSELQSARERVNPGFRPKVAVMKWRRCARAVDVLLVTCAIFTLWRVVAAVDSPKPRGSKRVTPQVTVGSAVALPAITWDNAQRNVVLVLSAKCPACNASIPFYKNLVAGTTAAGARLIVVSREAAETTRAWLQDNDISPGEVVQVSDLSTVRLSLLPALLIVDRFGIVTDIMLRKLTEAEQGHLLRRLADPTSPPLDNSQQVREINSQRAQELISTTSAQMLDVRSRTLHKRDNVGRGINIPAEEIAVRAPIELNRAVPVLVDCRPEGAGACRSTGWSLLDLGFREVFVVLTQP